MTERAMTERAFERVLVANRGEIACRILRAVREYGAQAIAVYSDADKNARHTEEADLCLRIGEAEPSASYLDMAKILDAARLCNADAIHPGYGFLSENAAFAEACEQAGFAFIGPTPKDMRVLGNKESAKTAALAAGVPTIPGFMGQHVNDDEMLRQAGKIGFPLLVKAVAGGGGRGMRMVSCSQDFVAALNAGKREAKQAFGDDRMLLEKYLQPVRHIEVQIFGDGRGNVLTLGERECSIQRRHQKIFEESPSPFVNAKLRARLEAAAVSLAGRQKYRGAGTIEFLVDEKRRFYFLEVNTRLQVEHPVTEAVTGLDLVRMQLRLAAGAPLDAIVDRRKIDLSGHALEARICAEDPELDFLPTSGRLLVCEPPSGPGIRVDSGYRLGSEISVHYDSLIAKLIVLAEDRRSCLARMEHALVNSAWLGLPTNVDFLLRVLRHESFQAGELRTDFVELHADALAQGEVPSLPLPVQTAAALAHNFVSTSGRFSDESSDLLRDPHSPWQLGDRFRTHEER